MNSASSICLLLTTAFAVTAAQARAQHQHAGDVIVGRSATSQLVFEADLNEPRLLAPAADPFQGWAGDEPGFDAFHSELPEGGLHPLAPGADIWLEIISSEPALLVVVPPNYDILDSPGQSAHLGDHDLHKHLIWLIDGTSPDFDPQQCIWQATFRLRDLGTTRYADSAPFTIRFANSNVALADFDCDADVDLADFLAFQACFNGPNRAPAATTCLHEDLDADADVDLADFLTFQACFNGPNRAPACP